MKKLLFVSALLIFVFSCKKERLNNDKEILVGTWELDFRESYYWGGPGWPFSLDTLRAGIETPNIELGSWYRLALMVWTWTHGLDFY